MQIIIINENSSVAQSIRSAAASHELDPSAFATGLLYAAYQKRTQSETVKQPSAPTAEQTSTPTTR